MGRELLLNSSPGLIIDQRRMLARVEPTLVRNPTGVDRVCQQPIKMPTRERFAAALGAIRRCAAFRAKPETVGLLLDPLDLKIAESHGCLVKDYLRRHAGRISERRRH